MPMQLSELKKKITAIKTKNQGIDEEEFRVLVVYLLKELLDKK